MLVLIVTNRRSMVRFENWPFSFMRFLSGLMKDKHQRHPGNILLFLIHQQPRLCKGHGY